MDKSNANEFEILLNDTMSGLTGDKIKLKKDILAWWWRALIIYDFNQVRQAFLHHTRYSQYKPTPASIIEIINKHDGRPSADEAWPIALKASDEFASLVWTKEIEQAWFHCYPVFSEGDKIGARIAFKQHYDRLVFDARERSEKPEWKVSVGFNQEERKNILDRAVSNNLITQDQATQLLPANTEKTEATETVTALLGYSTKTNTRKTEFSQKLRQCLADAQEISKQKEEQRELEKQKEKEALEHRRQELARQAKEWEEQHRSEYFETLPKQNAS